MSNRQPKLENGLTPLEARFCAEYTVDHKPAAALQRAGSKAKYLHQQAHEMLRKPHVVAEIQRLVSEQNEKVAVSKQWVLTELVLQYRAASTAALTGNTAERRLALAALDKIGDHVDVNAFRKQVGLGNPDGSDFDFGGLSDEEVDDLERLLSKAALSGTSESGTSETAH